MVIAWGWRNGSLEVGEYLTLEAAVVAAIHSGELAAEGWEVDGEWVAHDDPAVLSIVQDEYLRRRQLILAEVPRHSHTVEVRPPAGTGGWGEVARCSGAAEAEAIARGWRDRVGPDRVRVRPT